jgi:hypothetical protein
MSRSTERDTQSQPYGAGIPASAQPDGQPTLLSFRSCGRP